MGHTDWGRLYEQCRRDALYRGASEADAEDCAQEAITRALEADATHPPTHARRTARSIATQLEHGYTAERGPGRGITRPIPRAIAYAEDDPAPLVARHQAGVVRTCELHRQGLSSECEQEDLVLGREVAAEAAAAVARVRASLSPEDLARLERPERRNGAAEATSRQGVGSAARVARHRARRRAQRALDEAPPV